MPDLLVVFGSIIILLRFAHEIKIYAFTVKQLPPVSVFAFDLWPAMCYNTQYITPVRSPHLCY